MPLFAWRFFICGQPAVDKRLVRIQLRIMGNLRCRRRTVEVLHVHIFFNRFPVESGHRCNLGDVHALLIEQFSDMMYLIHCCHTPFLLVFVCYNKTRVMVYRYVCNGFFVDFYLSAIFMNAARSWKLAA